MTDWVSEVINPSKQYLIQRGKKMNADDNETFGESVFFHIRGFCLHVRGRSIGS
jgi:hypothetical protein